MHERTESFIEAEAAGHTWERRSTTPEDTHVLAHTHNWLNALPRGVRPVHLPADFPRIANDLARLWPETSAGSGASSFKSVVSKSNNRRQPQYIGRIPAGGGLID